MTRRLIARTAGPLVLACLLGLVLWLAAVVADDEEGDPAAGAAPAAAAFETAYATLRSDFEAGDALAPDGSATLAERTASVRAVRLAYSEFDSTVAEIAMPPGAAEDVAAMHAAIADLVVKFDLQGATTTVPAYQEANPAATAAYQAAEAAIERVREVLGTLGAPAGESGAEVEDLPEPGSLQEPVDPPYATPTRIAGATAWRDDLLRIGATNADTRYVDNESLGIRAGWVAAFPTVLTDSALVRDDVEAPLNGISGLEVRLPDPARAAARDNTPYLAFAVRDFDGTCAGGVISGYPALTTTTPVNLKRGEICSGLAVAAAAGFETG